MKVREKALRFSSQNNHRDLYLELVLLIPVGR